MKNSEDPILSREEIIKNLIRLETMIKELEEMTESDNCLLHPESMIIELLPIKEAFEMYLRCYRRLQAMEEENRFR